MNIISTHAHNCRLLSCRRTRGFGGERVSSGRRTKPPPTVLANAALAVRESSSSLSRPERTAATVLLLFLERTRDQRTESATRSRIHSMPCVVRSRPTVFCCFASICSPTLTYEPLCCATNCLCVGGRVRARNVSNARIREKQSFRFVSFRLTLRSRLARLDRHAHTCDDDDDVCVCFLRQGEGDASERGSERQECVQRE